MQLLIILHSYGCPVAMQLCLALGLILRIVYRNCPQLLRVSINFYLTYGYPGLHLIPPRCKKCALPVSSSLPCRGGEEICFLNNSHFLKQVYFKMYTSLNFVVKFSNQKKCTKMNILGKCVYKNTFISKGDVHKCIEWGGACKIVHASKRYVDLWTEADLEEHDRFCRTGQGASRGATTMI